MEYGGPERRKHNRIPMSARVKLPGSDKIDYLFARDISLGGIALTSETPLKKGKLLEMEIAVAGIKKIIKVTGKVVRKIPNNSGGYGVVFTRFAPYSKICLKETLEKLDKK